MKIAFLCEIPFERMLEFRQRIEDAVNFSNGKLIYLMKSNYPIRLVSGEENKYPPTYVPMTSGRVVNDASVSQTEDENREQSSERHNGSRSGNERRSMGRTHRGANHPHGDCRSPVSDVQGFAHGLRQRYYGRNRARFSDCRSHPAERIFAPTVCLRIPSGTGKEIDNQPADMTPSIGGAPIFSGA